MKRIINFVLFVIIGLQFASAQCKAKELVKNWKKELLPYYYDSYIIDEFQYKYEKQTIEIEFTCLEGLDYKLVFCTSKLPVPVSITIYDKPKTVAKRKIIYFDDSGKEGFLCSFTPPKTGSYFIEYDIPSGANSSQLLKTSGCVMLLIGIIEK
jgi:hypothetical protein